MENAKVTEKRSGFGYKAAKMAGRTAIGLGVGVCLGVGAIAAASIAEITIPAILMMKALGLTGGAVGFLSGAEAFKKKV